MISFSSHLFYSTHENSKLRLAGLKLSQFLFHILYILQKSFSFIISLNFPSGPTAVFSRIVPVSIFAVNGGVFLSIQRHMRDIRPIHIKLKFIKRFPKILYSSTTIILKRLMIWFITSTENLSPNIVKSLSIHSMFSSRFLESFYPRTTTRHCMSTFQVVAQHINFSPTDTLTFPQRISVTISHKALYSEKTKLLISYILGLIHIDILSRLRGLVKEDCGDKHYQPIKYHYV